MAEQLATARSRKRRRITSADFAALEELERGVATPIYDLAAANEMLLSGFSEEDVVSVLGRMPDMSARARSRAERTAR